MKKNTTQYGKRSDGHRCISGFSGPLIVFRLSLRDLDDGAGSLIHHPTDGWSDEREWRMRPRPSPFPRPPTARGPSAKRGCPSSRKTMSRGGGGGGGGGGGRNLEMCGLQGTIEGGRRNKARIGGRQVERKMSINRFLV